MAMINVLVVGGISMAVVGGTLEVMDRRVDQLRILRMQNRMDFIQKRVTESAGSPHAMTLSSLKKGSTYLATCLSGKTACRTDKEWPFELYNSDGDLLSKKYDINGNDCKRTCAIEVKTWFKVKCSGDRTACATPNEIVTRYEVRQTGNPQLLKKLFHGRQFKPLPGEVPLALFLCEREGEYMVGVAPDGTVTCAEPEQEVAALMCKNKGEYPKGIDRDGQMICWTPPPGSILNPESPLCTGPNPGPECKRTCEEGVDCPCTGPECKPTCEEGVDCPCTGPNCKKCEGPECNKTCNKDIAVLMVLDVSQSMTKDGDNKRKQRIDEAREAALNFVKMLRPTDEVATMTFSTGVKTLHAWSKPNTKVKDVIDRVKSDRGTTNMVDGLEYAFKLQKSASLDNKVVLFMSDGINEQDEGSVKKSASKFRDAGVDVWSIGFSPDVDDKEMEGIATNKSMYRRARTGAELKKVYEEIAKKDLCR
jgi:hypothetical protein